MPASAYGSHATPYSSPFSSTFPSPFTSPKPGHHGRAGLSLRTLVKLVPALFFCMYLATLVSWRRPVSATTIINELLASNFSLARAPAVVHLEDLVDSSPLLGICQGQKPMLQGVPSYVCQRLQVGGQPVAAAASPPAIPAKSVDSTTTSIVLMPAPGSCCCSAYGWSTSSWAST
jgi:hypothetical protein